MKIVITGHTRGLGKYLFEHFGQHHEVLGLSRTTGYNIDTQQTEIIDIATNADLFINCAVSNDSQYKLVLGTVNKVKNMIVVGTAMQQFEDLMAMNYIMQKRKLYELCKVLSIDPSVTTDILHLSISFLPKHKDSLVQTDNFISYNTVVKYIEFWLENKNTSEISFNWKLTNLVKEQFTKVLPVLDVNNLSRIKND